MAHTDACVKARERLDAARDTYNKAKVFGGPLEAAWGSVVTEAEEGFKSEAAKCPEVDH